MTANYQFDLVKHNSTPKQLKDYSWVEQRPIINFSRALEKGAIFFIPGEKLEIAINTAIAVGEPLLITGEPGTGKTQVAYYIAYKLSLEPVLHFQVKSNSKAKDLLYDFDTVRYFHDAQFTDQELTVKEIIKTPFNNLLESNLRKLDKMQYIIKRPLWEAIESDTPRVLLIDEIDKAPRDFPNDLLRELDQMEFDVPELKNNENAYKVSGKLNNRPIVVITSNSERRLPEPFLRRCIYHYIRFDQNLLERAVFARKQEFPQMNEKFLKLAISRFIELRQYSNLRKRPSTSELLTWLRVMAVAANVDPERLENSLSQLPYLGTLLKDHLDLEEIEKG